MKTKAFKLPAKFAPGRKFQLKATPFHRKHGVRAHNPYSSADNYVFPSDIGTVEIVNGNGWDALRLSFERGRTITVGTFYTEPDGMPCRMADAGHLDSFGFDLADWKVLPVEVESPQPVAPEQTPVAAVKPGTPEDEFATRSGYKPKNGLTMLDHCDLARRALAKSFPKLKIGESAEWEGKTIKRISKIYYHTIGGGCATKARIIGPRANAEGAMRYRADNPDAPKGCPSLDALAIALDAKLHPGLREKIDRETEAMKSLETPAPEGWETAGDMDPLEACETPQAMPGVSTPAGLAQENLEQEQQAGETEAPAPVKPAKYGYVIVSTPGLVQDGFFPLTKSGDRAEEDPDAEPVAIYGTREAAETAMLAMTPEGSTPAVWAGLSVMPAWDACPRHLVYRMVEGMHGFQVPTVA